jgi:hypothetical protein
MKSRSRLLAFVSLLASALIATACAGAPPIPFNFEFSDIRVSRDYAHADRYDDHRGHDHGYGRASSCSCSCRSSDAIKLIGGSQRGKGTRPSGWHKREWFERRGYDLENYTHRHRDGSVHRGRHVGHRH